MNHFVVHLKLTQHYKSTGLQFKKKFQKANLSLLAGNCLHCIWRFPGGSDNKEPANKAGDARDVGSVPFWGRFPWSRKWQPTPEFLPGKFCGQRSLAGYRPHGRKELDTTEATEHGTAQNPVSNLEVFQNIQESVSR